MNEEQLRILLALLDEPDPAEIPPAEKLWRNVARDLKARLVAGAVELEHIRTILKQEGYDV